MYRHFGKAPGTPHSHSKYVLFLFSYNLDTQTWFYKGSFYLRLHASEVVFLTCLSSTAVGVVYLTLDGHSSDVINIVKSKLTFYPLLSGLTSDPRAGSSKGHVAVEEANKRTNQSILFSMQSSYSNKDCVYIKMEFVV